VLGEAEFSGVIAVTRWPIERARTMLPGGIALERPAGWRGGGHPVVVLFGVQARGATRLAGVRLPLGRSYLELAVAVPGVCRGGEPMTALARMYADYFPAAWNGRVRYGFGKEHAEIRRTDGSFVVARPAGPPLCAAVHAPAGAWAAAARAPGPPQVAAWLSAPLIGWTPAGRAVRSASSWDVDGRLVRPVRASVHAFTPLLAGCGPGELLEDAAAFEVRNVRWSLGWPEADGRDVAPGGIV